MSEVRRGHALWTLRWRIALATLALGVLAYPIAWNADPWIFGTVVLGLGPVQGAVGCLGILGRLTRLDRHIGGPMAWIVDILLVATAVAVFAFVRTISWA